MNGAALDELKKRWAISLVVLVLAGAVAAYGFNLAVRFYPPDGLGDPAPLAVDSADPNAPPALPYACPIAGDCKLPGDERRTARPSASPSGEAGNDRILPPD